MATYGGNPIFDPDLLTYVISSDPAPANAELIIDTTNLKLILKVFGNLTTDGVTIKCVYSKLKEVWKSDATLIKYLFPMGPITDEQFEMINGWNWDIVFTSGAATATTPELIRTGGWSVVNAAGAITEMWAGLITLGTLGTLDQVYLQQVDSENPSENILLTGPVNQAVQILSDPNGDGVYGDGFDRRAYFKLFVREYQKIYAQSQIEDIGVASMTYQAYRFPLTNAADLKITASDADVSTLAPYTSITITYYGADQQRLIGSTNYPFRVIVEGNNATAEQIYEKIQYQLRQAADIDAGAGTVTGKTADALLRFVGDTLVTSTGVYIDNFQAADTNRITFSDQNGVERTFPFVAVLQLNFGDNLQNDPDAIYRVFFTSNPGGNFGTADAIIVNDNDAAPMAGDITGAAFVQKSFNYDGNVQGGRTAGTDAPVTAVAIGLSTSQYVRATGTIGRSTANTIALTSALERNYESYL